MGFSVRYMGSKRSLAAQISREISERSEGAIVLDAFSGMCAVGAEVAPRHPLITNDAHAFAQIVAEAMFVSPGPAPTSLHARDELTSAFARNAKWLREAAKGRLRIEAEALARIDEPGGWKRLVAFNESELDIGHPRYPDGCSQGRSTKYPSRSKSTLSVMPSTEPRAFDEHSILVRFFEPLANVLPRRGILRSS
jgi:hypothetical protein